MQDIVYVRMKKYVEVSKKEEVRLKDIAMLSVTSKTTDKNRLEHERIYHITDKDSQYVVIDGFLIIKHLNEAYPDLEIQLAGPSQTIIHVTSHSRKIPLLAVAAVWLVLFIGAAMTIMNFHYDVSMQSVQQKLHYLFTGEENNFPLWIQIPYSLGLGLGMLLFFNHWFKKRFNEEPSPLEVEIFKYQQSLDDYVIHHENVLNDANHPR